MASNQGEESGNQNPNQDQGKYGDQNQNQGQDQGQIADRPWLRITPVLAQNLEPHLPNPPVAVREIIDVTQSTEPHRILEYDIPRPLDALGEGEVQAYAEGYEPEAGKEGDTTEWVHGQTYAHENNLPRRFRLMLLARTHEEFEKMKEPKKSKKKKKTKDERENLTDENGNEVSMSVKKGGIMTEIKIKENPILPRHISSQVEGWRIVMWMMYDPDIHYRDIHARVRKPFRNASRKQSKKGKEKNETKESEEETGIYTYLSQRIPRWRRSARGGQFSTEERQKTSGKPSEHDRITASNHFDEGPGPLNNDERLAHFNNMASGGRLNRIYWNTPWDIFQTKNDDGKPEILVQQRNAMVNDTYFRADYFSSDPRERERVYHALWKSYFPTEETSNEDQPRDEYLQRNFDSILSIMRRLEVDYGAIQNEVLKRDQQDNNGMLDFAGEFATKIAYNALKSTIHHLNLNRISLGLSKRWALCRDGNKIKERADIDANPTRAAERLKEAIALLFADLRQTLDSWDHITFEKSKFDEIETPEECSILSGHQIEKAIILDQLVINYRTEYMRLTPLGVAFIQKQKDRSDLGLKTERQELNRDMEEVAGRFLSLLRMQAEVLAPPIVYYLKPFENGIDGFNKAAKLTEILQAVRVVLVGEFQKHSATFNHKSAFYKLDVDPSQHLREESLQEFLKEREKLRENAGTGGKKPTGMGKKPKNKADSSGKDEAAGTAAAASGSGSGISLDTGSGTVELGLQSRIGYTPINPYGKNPSLDELFNQSLLNRELDKILSDHGISVEFPQDQTNFFKRLHHVLAVFKFEDVLSHLRISKPVIEFLSDPERSNRAHRDFKDAVDLARAVDLALVKARYRSTPLYTESEYLDYQDFFKQVVYVLDLNDQDWARSVREKRGTFQATEESLIIKVGESPTKMHSNLRSQDMLDQNRLRRDIQDVLAAHGRQNEIPTNTQSACDLIRTVLENIDFEDLLGHYRISKIVLYILRRVDKQNQKQVIRLATAVDDAMVNARIIKRGIVNAGMSTIPAVGAVADELQRVLGAWVAHVRQKAKLGTSPIDGGYINLYQKDDTSQDDDTVQDDGTTTRVFDRACFNYELDRVLRSHEYTAKFKDDEVFEDRIGRVVRADFVDVLGHYRIAVPILRILRAKDNVDVTQRLALSVDKALRDAGYTTASLQTPDLEDEEDPDAALLDKVADALEEALPMWTAQVRFTLQNNADYALSHPKDPRPQNVQRLF